MVKHGGVHDDAVCANTERTVSVQRCRTRPRRQGVRARANNPLPTPTPPVEPVIRRTIARRRALWAPDHWRDLQRERGVGRWLLTLYPAPPLLGEQMRPQGGRPLRFGDACSFPQRFFPYFTIRVCECAPFWQVYDARYAGHTSQAAPHEVRVMDGRERFASSAGSYVLGDVLRSW